MATKKARSEYMKKFKDPKWETFSKCYEDSLKYRMTRRVMEGAHRPWFWEGWDSSSDSSGWSTPRLLRNRVAPLSVAPPQVSQRRRELHTSPRPRHGSGGEDPEEEPGGVGGGGDWPKTEAAVMENGPGGANANDCTALKLNGFHSDNTATDNGPIDSASSDGEALHRRPRERPRRRAPPPRSGPRHAKRDDSHGDGDRPERSHADGDRPAHSHDDRETPVVAAVRKAPRAKSQPPTSSKDRESRLDWTDTRTEARRTPHHSHTSDACVQTGRPRTGHRSSMRRTRSADLEKIRKSQLLTVADSPWVTEYMRCFSARVR